MYHSDLKKKVIVAGGRDFKNFELMKKKLDAILSRTKLDIQIVSGGAKGADLMGEAYATLKGHDIKVFPADWKTFGKSAGYKRNEQMAEYADAVVVFWDGKSRGTQHMINIAKKNNLPLRIVRY